MLPYLLCFTISVFSFFIAEKVNKNKIFSCLAALIGILVLCLLAGLRSENIGTDIGAYTKPIYTAAISSSTFTEYLSSSWYAQWRYLYVHDFEIGFTTLVFIITKIFNSFPVVLFSIELCIVVPIYLSLKNIKGISASFGMLVFCLMFYNVTFNIMRQWIAMALILYAFSFVINNNKKAALILLLIAVAFHTTALIAFVLYAMYYYTVILPKNGNKFVKIRIDSCAFTYDEYTRRIIVIFIISILFLIFFGLLPNILNLLGLSKYAYYISGSITLSINGILLRLPIIILFIIYFRKIQDKTKWAPFLLAVLLVDVVFSQLSSIASQSWRISAWVSFFNIISYPILLSSISNKRSVYLIRFIIFIYMVLYWLYYFVFQGVHQTIPYVFS